MRRFNFSIPATSMAVLALAAVSGAACDNDTKGSTTDDITTKVGASVTVPQTPLSGNSVAKFVDALPLLSDTRSDGTTTQQITMQEFQQKILPNAFYNGLSGVNRNGTFTWGYNINGAGASFPARTIESRRGAATTAIYTNNL